MDLCPDIPVNIEDNTTFDDARVTFDDARVTFDDTWHEGALTAILFAAGEPVKLSRLGLALELPDDAADALLRRIAKRMEASGGIRLLELGDAWQLSTAPEYAPQVRRALEQRRPPALSQSALEVLSIVAYRQPATRAYVERVRGVDSGYTLGQLAERGIIEDCGRLDAPGRPILYRTTAEFLRIFGLPDLSALPPLEDGLPPMDEETPGENPDTGGGAPAEWEAKV